MSSKLYLASTQYQAVIKQVGSPIFRKLPCWKIFLNLPNNVLDEFSSLGGSTLPSDSTLNTFEQFVLRLYGKNKVPSGIKNLSDLRWKMFSKQQADSQRLPPTSDIFRQKVLRSHYTVMVWKQSHIPSQTLLNPEECGWKLDANEEYQAVTTILPPAAESIIHLTVCHCKTKCVAMRCKCRKNGLKCSEMCECLECENDGSDERDSNEIEDDLDNYI